MKNRQQVRFWEVDFLRGMAIVMMVLFHMAFDLNYFGIRQIDVNSGLWFYLARFTALLFLLLVGVSLTLSHSRACLLGEEDRFRLRLMKRSLWIFGLAMGVTLVTYFFIREGFIVFGVLHLIGVSLMLAYPFLRLNGANFIFGLLLILTGLYLQNLPVDYLWLLWLGLAPAGFYSVDYFPLLPWFGVILVGVAFGDLFYQGYRRRVPLPDLAGSSLVRGIEFLGRNSLAIYLVHQPVLIGLMYLGGALPPWMWT